MNPTPSPRELFDRFAPVIASLTNEELHPPKDKWADWMDDRLQISQERLASRTRERMLAVHYAPFDFVNDRARLAIVGITPGVHQMFVALRSARASIQNGLTLAETAREAKRLAAFEGSMRKRLVGWLDDLGVAPYLGIRTCGHLFTPEGWSLVHTASVIRYPTRLNWTNYSGSNPGILNNPTLRTYAEYLVREELAALPPRSLIVPLGAGVARVLKFYVDHERLEPERILFGFPHPSLAPGAAERERAFREAESSLRQHVQRWYG